MALSWPIKKLVTILMMGFVFCSCDFMRNLEEKSARINRFEIVALHLAKENDLLKAQVGALTAEIETLKSQNNFLQLKLSEEGKTGRTPASIPAISPENDLVKFQTYQWRPAQLVAMAQKEFKLKNFEKSSQFFQTLLVVYPKHQALSDQILFQSGLSAYETGKHDAWVIKDMSALISKYPLSSYYRGAKLWMSLAHLRMGKEQEFFNTVEEFRKKYRNTTEWDIISVHYEKMLQKYKK